MAQGSLISTALRKMRDYIAARVIRRQHQQLMQLPIYRVDPDINSMVYSSGPSQSENSHN